MAQTTIQSNNRRIQFRREITREYVRGNLFSPYYGDSVTSIIRNIYDAKKGGEQINIPLVTRLTAEAKSTGTLTGNEESIENYGMRAYVDWARNAVKTSDAEEQKDSADIFGEAKPLLSDWGKELQRDELIAAFMALPTESAPAGLGSSAGQRTNGILYQDATAAQRNTWNSDNQDRVLYGNAVGNYNATHATALANVDATNDKLIASSVTLLKRRARLASPRIRPWKVEESAGREYFVLFAGSLTFRDLKNDATMVSANREARAREGNAMDKNPIFQDGDLIYDGVIIREIPEISDFVTNVWTTLLTAGAASARVEPVFLCGQQAAAMAWATMPTPTTLDDTDYQFLKGVGVKMCYGVSKIFKKHPSSAATLKQWGVLTGWFSGAADA